MPVLCKVCKIRTPQEDSLSSETKSKCIYSKFMKRWVVALEAIPGKLGMLLDEGKSVSKALCCDSGDEERRNLGRGRTCCSFWWLAMGSPYSLWKLTFVLKPLETM